MKDTNPNRPCLKYIIMGLTSVTCIMVVLGAVRGASLGSGASNDVGGQAGLSVACQGPRSIGQMAEAAEIVTSAVVVDVSPARDNVYAVTLQVNTNIDILILGQFYLMCFVFYLDHESIQGPVRCRRGHYRSFCPASIP